MVGRVGLAGSVMTAIAFGIVVDDTIHFLTKYLQARRDSQDAPAAIRSAFRTVGYAMWTTTAMLALGFLVALTIFLALIADFLLLPPLLMALDRRKS